MTTKETRIVSGMALLDFRNWRTHVSLNCWRYDIVPLEIACEGPGNEGFVKQYIVSGFVLTEFDDTATIPIAELAEVRLMETQAAMLAEQLWNAGARPASAKASEGYKDACDAHIADLRKELDAAHQHIERLQAIISELARHEPKK